MIMRRCLSCTGDAQGTTMLWDLRAPETRHRTHYIWPQLNLVRAQRLHLATEIEIILLSRSVEVDVLRITGGERLEVVGVALRRSRGHGCGRGGATDRIYI